MSQAPPTTPALATFDVEPTTRSAFLLRAALATGATYGALAVGPFVHRALAQASSDADILNFALALEYLEADFYVRAARRLTLSREVRDLANQLGDNELEHVNNIVSTVRGLGAQPAKKPTFSFPIKDERGFVKLASTLEDTGVSAYNGAAPRIKSKAVLRAAGRIVQVEARHAAIMRVLNDELPMTGAFDRPAGQGTVLTAVKPFIVG
jgi:rubrerythrin